MVCFDSINWADLDEISIRSDEFEENGFPEIAWAMRWIVKNGKKPGPLPHLNGIDYTWWRCNGDTWERSPINTMMQCVLVVHFTILSPLN
jgi:hypothetical protein